MHIITPPDSLQTSVKLKQLSVKFPWQDTGERLLSHCGLRHLAVGLDHLLELVAVFRLPLRATSQFGGWEPGSGLGFCWMVVKLMISLVGVG